MFDKDFYERLGISREASDDDIKRAFRRLAQKYHPDKHKGDKDAEETFKAINEAYLTLKDPQKRAAYDRFGQVGPQGSGFRDSGFSDFGFGDFQDIFSDVFTDFFGGQRRQPGGRGADLQCAIEISFEEAAFGTEKKIEIPRTVGCMGCNGSGAKSGTQPAVCSDCHGTGQQRLQQGFFTVQSTCQKCAGAGKIISNPCAKCRGTGHEKKRETISVKIPAGIDSNSRLRISGEGNQGARGTHPGDLYVGVTVREHPIFERHGDDVLCEVPIAFSQATLGAEIEVPTLEGPIKLKVPEATQSGRVFRLSGKGIASVHTGRRGDQHVLVKIETPTKLSKQQRELLEEFASISGEDTMPRQKSFFNKVKDLFE